MKKFLIICLCLTGCVTAPLIQSKDVQPEFDHESVGTANNVYWYCSQNEVNDSLVWVVCDFKNASSEPAHICLDVSYSGKGKTVSNHRNICSSVMEPGEVFTNYAAFINDKKQNERARLNELCGKNMEGCSLNTRIK